MPQVSQHSLMPAEEFRAARQRLRLTRAELLAVLHGLGWTTLTIRAVDQWGTRGAPLHVAAILALMERALGTWRAVAVPPTEPEAAKNTHRKRR